MADTESQNIYQDSRANYQDIPYLRKYEQEPDTAPRPVPDIVPFPVWVVPPGWRLARLADIAQATGSVVSPLPENAAALLAAAGVTYAPTIDPLSVWGWSGTLVTWQVAQSGEYLVLWRIGTA